MAVQVTHVAGGFVVEVHDIGELDVVHHLAGQLGAGPSAAVVVDVSGMTMAPIGGVEQLVGRIRAAASEGRSLRWSLVAARLTARRLLRQLCAGSTIGVFPDVDAALAAMPPGLASTSGAAS